MKSKEKIEGNLLNNINTNIAKTFCLPLAFLASLFIVGFGKRCNKCFIYGEYSNRWDKNIKTFNGLPFYLSFSAVLIYRRSNVVFSCINLVRVGVLFWTVSQDTSLFRQLCVKLFNQPIFF